MLYQISSGMGPLECSIAVYKLYKYLDKIYHGALVLSYINPDKRLKKGAFKSCIIDVDKGLETALDTYIGTIQWTCESSVRQGHKRKNWFINVTKLPELELKEADEEKIKDELIISLTHSGGPGGQNVNKVETGVIAQYKDIIVKCTEERSQLQNKNRCIKKILAIIEQSNNQAKADNANVAWQDHNNLIRGNPVKIFKGKDFKEV